MDTPCSTLEVTPVALLAEGVDRNDWKDLVKSGLSVSPSSRRAWIEIMLAEAETLKGQVALLTEGVDRNTRAMRTGPVIFHFKDKPPCS